MHDTKLERVKNPIPEDLLQVLHRRRHAQYAPYVTAPSILHCFKPYSRKITPVPEASLVKAESRRRLGCCRDADHGRVHGHSQAAGKLADEHEGVGLEPLQR